MDEQSSTGNLATMAFVSQAVDVLCPLIEQAEILLQKYHVVVTNPPYMGSSNMSKSLADFVKKHYPDSKSDLFAVFIEQCHEMTAENGYQAMITQHSWMFLSSYEKLRKKLLQSDTINMAHLGPRAFDEIGGEVVQTTSFVMRNTDLKGYKGVYCRLIDPTSEQGKEEMFLAKENRYVTQQSNFSKIPGSPVAYWVSERLYYLFSSYPSLDEFGKVKVGLQTGNNELYYREWYEVFLYKIGFDTKQMKWLPCIKGGDYRKWFGNLGTIINWENNGFNVKQEKGAVIRNESFYFRSGISWTKVSTLFGARFIPQGMILTDASVFSFPKNGTYVLAFLNSCIAKKCMEALNPTLNFVASSVGSLPIINSNNTLIDKITTENIRLSKFDWNSDETSWDFKCHPLV